MQAERNKKNNKNRRRSAVIASLLAVAILLTGTFAWQSISQQAKNETITSVNAGGRLHDDFDGTNKDVYVENFTDPDDMGVPIFARIRLDEYIETGLDAGMEREAADRRASALLADTDINDVKTWKTHKPDVATPGDMEVCALETHDYWKWTMGGATTFMPTFNKNCDSLKADINGTLEGPDGAITTEPDDDRYEDYIDYTNPVNASKTANAVYDADSNDVDEEGKGLPNVEGTNYTLKEETHIVKETQTGTVIPMSQWLADGQKPGKYWVYDTDGWAYWAEAIAPGEATGLLLDEIEMTNKTDENCYYGINVVAQFATAHNFGKEDNTGFYGPDAGEKPSENAELLLHRAAGTKSVITVTAAGGATEVTADGPTLQFSATATLNGIAVDDGVTWSIEGNGSTSTTISAEGVLDVAEDEPAEELTVCAKSKANEGVGKLKIKVNRTPIGEIKSITPGSRDTVTIDGIDWYVLVNDETKNQALLWSKEMIPSWGTSGVGAFGTSNNTWRDSTVRSWFNGDFFNSLTYLKTKAVETNIKTRTQIDTTTFIPTTDKVFALSEADLFGTFNGKGSTATDYPVQPDDFTYGGKVIVPDVEMRKCNATLAGWYWLRSPHSRTSYNAVVATSGGYTIAGHTDIRIGVRSAMWVSLAP